MTRRPGLIWSASLVVGALGAAAGEITLPIERPGPVDPIALDEANLLTNAEAVVPPQRYTRLR